MSDAHARMVRAAIVLATIVDVDDRRANDPDQPGERGPRADALRAEQRAQALREFRTASAELEASL